MKERHPEAINLARTICLNDNEYVMIESTRVNSDISRIIFNQLFEQNKDLVKI